MIPTGQTYKPRNKGSTKRRGPAAHGASAQWDNGASEPGHTHKLEPWHQPLKESVPTYPELPRRKRGGGNGHLQYILTVPSTLQYGIFLLYKNLVRYGTALYCRIIVWLGRIGMVRERTWYDNVEVGTGWDGLERNDMGWVGTRVNWSMEAGKLEYPMFPSSPRGNKGI